MDFYILLIFDIYNILCAYFTKFIVQTFISITIDRLNKFELEEQFITEYFSNNRPILSFRVVPERLAPKL